MLAIKICPNDRVRRIAVIVHKASQTLIPDVITEASKKLGIDGDSLVSEEDGIVIDDDFLIIEWKCKLFMLLEKNQHWSPTDEADNINCSEENHISNTKSSQKNSRSGKN